MKKEALLEIARSLPQDPGVYRYFDKENTIIYVGKTYPYICISKERFPKLYFTRTVNKKEAYYFGPYSSILARNGLIDILRSTFHFRTCNLNLSKENVQAGKYNVCMEYHIGNCKGPCINAQTEDDYMREVSKAKDILKGKFGSSKDILVEEMSKLATKMKFEEAAKVKEKLLSLEQFESKSIVANPNVGDIEIYTIIVDGNKGFINFIQISNGVITASNNNLVKNTEDFEREEILIQWIVNNRESNKLNAKNILSNIDFEYPDASVEVNVPKIGDKKKLINLTLKADLRMKELPKHIECFDNSNIQGTNPVASMVCFKMGKASKKDYRHYKIKTVEGPDDFASMKEIVERRYSRLVRENEPLPQLIIIDGGKGQLSSAVEILKNLGVYEKLVVIGIAKKLEEIYFPGDSYPVMINKKSESLKLIQKLRNEAHRFAITFHRDLRSKNFIKSSLTEIEGIGPKTVEKLLRKYKTIKAIKELPEKELEAFIGKAIATKLKENL